MSASISVRCQLDGFLRITDLQAWRDNPAGALKQGGCMLPPIPMSGPRCACPFACVCRRLGQLHCGDNRPRHADTAGCQSPYLDQKNEISRTGISVLVAHLWHAATDLLAVVEPLAHESWSRKAIVTGAGRVLEQTVLFYERWMVGHERTHLKQIQRIVSTIRRSAGLGGIDSGRNDIRATNLS
jgi:hypothetical protein